MTTPYEQPGYGAVPQPHPRGVPVLILGIVGLVICFPCGIIAVVLGNGALKEIDANPGAYTNRGMVNAGRILGIIAIVIWVIGLIARFALSHGN
ncbi:hypothetical protein GCM10011575_40490 [Microlunatus endophyticus]|uniref:DUF4190 domain-containing protein n=1 Tax=Microlunatus endophyticus TaxID=1716077 RepID=A0A917W8S9_9ACTN|nr:DUF4190 domain-containing protein [Microlunatus endophyticus]GGL78087.1 hypothetical protein GCM10011575_40490 [Microlunatus endophyticus]